ncbi:MAG: hypothetical protein KA488_02375 [Flavobacterium sp.]|jgi:hypothetical protein|nr:hypothetical protein [Flavobacterium sp.]MBP6099456.1 hypothetical protein [Flavobacterium sp.]
MKLRVLIAQIDIQNKLKSAPDDQYQIGILIGSFVPMIVFAGIAYYLYFRAKNRTKNQ